MSDEIPYDAILIVAFGGPEGPDDVMPFLENVVRGKNIPIDRLQQVAEHYELFGGVSPINAQIRSLIVALVDQLNTKGPSLPVYWGNRNWHPMLTDTIQQMANDGIKRAVAWFTSPYSSYSSCRQYLENLQQACDEVGPTAPRIEKLRGYYNHPLFLNAEVQRTQQALEQIEPQQRKQARLIFTAHSIPLSMAENCQYEAQLREVSQHVAKAVGIENWRLVFQSRSGPPHQPWLEPDICDFLRHDCSSNTSSNNVIIVPIGFISDHLEVLYDLDIAAQRVCDELNLNLIRARTLENHPTFIEMIRQLIEERTSGTPNRPVVGTSEAVPDICPADCCRLGRT